MNNIEIVPVFGTSFTIYVPIIMTIIALITLFDGFARILQFLGIETEDALVQTNGFCGMFRKKQEMDQELLEKCNNGKSVIASEIRAMNLLHEKLKRNRTTGADTNPGRESFTSTSSNSNNIISAIKESVVKSTTGKPHYSNIEFTKPSSIDDDDDLENSFENTQRYSGGFVRLGDDDDDLGGGSIFSSSLAGNNYQDFSKSKSKPKSTGHSSQNTFSKSSSSTAPKPSKYNNTKSNSLFSIEDDDDDSSQQVRGGRYSDV